MARQVDKISSFVRNLLKILSLSDRIIVIISLSDKLPPTIARFEPARCDMKKPPEKSGGFR